MTYTHSNAASRTLTERMLAAYLADHGDAGHPTCRKCGRKLRAGDSVDCFHPWEHAGNICKMCVKGAAGVACDFVE